jgi:photosystem II stability/assembly factor-like uncharacterized protein
MQDADEWLFMQRAFPFKEVPEQERQKAIEHVRKNIPASEYENVVWTLAGPTNIEGRITSIDIHPTIPQTVIVGTANGGVWKSTNFCQTWISIFDNMNTSSIGSVTFDPSNGNIIYVGTGESNSLRSYYPGTGIYKSTNGGSSWTFLGLADSYSISNIVISPLNTQEVYLSALGALRHPSNERGIYKSVNGGLNWTRVLFISDSVGFIDIVIDPLNPSKLLAASWERTRREDFIKYGGPNTALYMSTNSGQNWSIITNGFPSNSPDLGRISLDISISNPNVVYALTAYTSGYNRGLYKSTNGGTVWTYINSTAGGSSSYAWFNRQVRVHPANPDYVVLAAFYCERSTNGGVSFSNLYSSHVDFHAVYFSPSNPNYIVVGNDGGVDYSSNAGASFQFSTSLPISQFYAGEIDNSNPNVLLGGLQDNGTVRTLTGGLSNWTEIYGGDGFVCKVDPTNPQKVYASSQNGGLGRSTNGGSSFFSGTSGLQGAGTSMTNWMTPYILDKNNPSILYAGTYMIHRSTNSMVSWYSISPDLSNGHVQNLGTITTIDVSASNPNVIYCGTDDANVWVTTNLGTNWTKIVNGLPKRWVTRVTIHPDSANICYVTLSGYKVDSTGAHIFRTANYGNTWTSISSNLPDAPINDVLVDPMNNSRLFIATDINVMYSTNTGGSWSILGTGIPSAVPVHDLTLHNQSRTLVAWTHGRSAFKLNLNLLDVKNISAEIPNGFVLSQNYPNPFNPATKIRFSIPAGSSLKEIVRLDVYNTLGQMVSTLVNNVLKPGMYETVFNAGGLSSGIYFYKLSINNSLIDTKKMIFLK